MQQVVQKFENHNKLLIRNFRTNLVNPVNLVGMAMNTKQSFNYLTDNWIL